MGTKQPKSKTKILQIVPAPPRTVALFDSENTEPVHFFALYEFEHVWEDGHKETGTTVDPLVQTERGMLELASELGGYEGFTVK